MTKEKIVDNKLKSNLSYHISCKIKSLKIIKQIADVANLELAWYKVKKNTCGLLSDKNLRQEMLSGETGDWFYNISKTLLNGKYKYKKASEIAVVTKNGSFLSFKIVSLQDVVVQKAFLLVLSEIFEKQNYLKLLHKKITFSNYFTSKFMQSVHSVMRIIKLNWGLLNYFATCCVDRKFNKVNNSILMKGLEEYIKDKKVCNEIWKMLNSRSVYFNITAVECNSLGTPKGSVLSPFLFNVYMTKFDRFLESLGVQTSNKSTIANNIEWLQSVKNSVKIKYFFFSRMERLKLWRESFKKFKKNKTRSEIITEMGFKLSYVRYMDDFITGYYGKKSDVKESLKRIETFIKSNLQLNCTRFKLINARSSYVDYLGFRLKCLKKEKASSQNRLTRAFDKLKNRLLTRKLIENSRYLKILEWAGFKFYRKIVEQVIRDPQQIFVKQGVEFTNMLAQWGERDGLIYLISALKQSLPSLDLAIENLDSSIKESSYKMAEHSREIQFNKFLQRWSESAKILAQTDIINEVKEYLPLQVVRTFDMARNNFLRQINKLHETKINLIQVKNVSLIHSRFVPFSQKKINLKMGHHSIKMYMNVKTIMEKFKDQGIVNTKYRPICINKICSLEDYQIINQIAIKAHAFMHFYSCVDNLWQVKKFVDYTLRYSLAATLARKFKISLKKIFQLYGKDLSVRIKFKGQIVKVADFPCKNIVDSFKFKFNTNKTGYDRLAKNLKNVPLKTLTLASLNLFNTCGVVSCQVANNVEIYHVKILTFRGKDNPISSQNKDSMRANFCWQFLESVFRRKAIPLCHEHSIKLAKGFLTFFDLNFDSIIYPTRVLKRYSLVENSVHNFLLKTNLR